ncbi:MAG: hypothetical protein JST49_03900 [Bacteroidetes bacterium]|nr:hypothetical protein [Bacteroidota bacterium]
MQKLVLALCLMACLAACNRKPADNTTTTETATNTKPKGEFAFLLNYNGQMPEDVGLLTNHIVQRRLANVMKDSMLSYVRTAAYAKPILVIENDQLLIATFFSDSDRTEPAAGLIIDVKNDALWANYWSGDSLLEYTDHPELPEPGSE